PSEQRAVIDDNGFRIGVIGGALPIELQNLLASKRSCPDPRRIQTHAGSSTSIALGPTDPGCEFQLHEDGKTTPAALKNADFKLQLTPTPADGRIRLQVVPEVMHGDTALLPRPAADRSGWELQQHRPTERYSSVSWEVAVAPGQYLL